MLKVIMWIVAGLVILFVGAGLLDAPGRKAGERLQVGKVDFSSLKDGIYEGQYMGGRWSNKVRVTVASGKVTGIGILRDVWFRKPELTEQVVSDVIKSQSLEVDIVSGATVTTRAYLKAVENALAEKK
ncbi:MAG TPA: FMN-binding protein [Bacillota bacterium]|nr:FMN-binding protein [Bacillota bacterium]